LATWKLDRVPGMSMDEAWSIVAARGGWPAANPLSGMSIYTAPFPVLLLELFGTRSGLLVLRGASVVTNGAMLVSIALMLRRLYPERRLAGWALPLIATCPVLLVAQRTGIEVIMFTPFLTVLGLCLFTRGPGWSAFAAGVCWGLLVYNHLLGLWALVSLWLAWLVVYRRLLPIGWKPALAGFSIGVLPRFVALVLYDNQQITGLVTSASPTAALTDLRWLPGLFWDTLQGRTVYLRYWLVALLVLLPWVRRWRMVPRHAWFTLVAVASFCVLATVGAPNLAVRFFVLPVVGLAAFVAVLAAAAIEVDQRWALVVRGAALALAAGNLFYLINNFYLPWDRRELSITSFFFGTRSPYTGSWHYLPKDELARSLRELDPAPEQIVSVSSLTRPLRALLDDTGIRIVTPDEADKKLRSVWVDYRSSRYKGRYCTPVPGGRMCFRKSSVIDQYFVLYR
jgi:hypothetical protein